MVEVVVSANNPDAAARADAVPCVFIVDDDISVRESLELLLESAGWNALAFACATEFLAYPKALVPSCLLLDIALPDVSGLDVQDRLTCDFTTMPIVFITGCVDIPSTVRAMKAGATEFLIKPLHQEELLAAIERALEVSRARLRREAEISELRNRYTTLTRREAEVMTLVVAGRLNKQVAAELGISEVTVKTHRGNLMRKMTAGTLPGLVKMAARLGIAA